MSFDLGSAHGSVRLDADIKGLQTAQAALVGFEKQAAETSAKVQRSFADVGRSLQRIGAGMSLAITAPAILAAKESIGAASDLVEAQSAVNTIFAEGAAQIQAFAQSAATNLGLSRTAALNAAVGFAGMGKAAGLTGAELADFSQQLVTNAADLASFFNEDPGAMLDRLRSGLAGEAEPLRRFGIDLTEANVQLKAMELGLGDSTGALTQQEKVLARNAVIQASLGAAEGDRARTADQLAGSLRTLQSSTQDLAAAMGQTLLPTVNQAVHVLTAAVTAFNAAPEPVKNVTVAVVALAAIAGPAAVGIGTLAIALAALQTATILGTPALVALTAAAAPLAAILGTTVVVGGIAKQIIDAKNAADEAADPVDTLTNKIREMTAAMREASEVKTAIELRDQWAALKTQIDAATKAEQEAINTELAAGGGGDPGTGALDAHTMAMTQGNAALVQRIEALDKYQLTSTQATAIEADLRDIMEETGDEFLRDADDARIALDALLAHNAGAEDTVRKLDGLAHGTTAAREGLAGEATAAKDANTALDVHAKLVAAAQRIDDTAGIFNRARAWEALADSEIEAAKAHQEYVDAVERGRSALAEQAQLQTGMGMPGPGTQAEVQDITKDVQANETALARQRDADAARRRELEQQTVDEIRTINEGLVDTLRGLDDQREANNRNMHRALVLNERNTAQEIRSLEGQATAARQQAAEQLAGIADQRADNEQALAEGLVAAQESANESFADIAKQRVELQQNAAEQMVAAEEAATEQMTALAERRKQVEKDTAASLQDSREQASDALADVGKRQVEIQETLRASLTDAQQQYNDALADIAAAQNDVRDNLQEQLSDLTKAWHQQGADLERQAKDIRAQLRASLREMDAEWESLNNKNLRAQRTLRGELQDTLKQQQLNARHLREDLRHVQGDDTFTDTEKEDARVRTERALEGLALDRQLAERNASRDIADLEGERRDQQKQYETERENAVQQAQRDLRALNRQRMEGEKQYHDRRVELEQDAADRIAELNDQRRQAVEALATAETDAQETANGQMQDLADDRIKILEDQADRERDIRSTSRGQYKDLANDQVAIEQDLADKRRTIQEDTAKRMEDLATREGEIAQDLADQQQILRNQAAEREQDLADRETTINNDLQKRLAEIEHNKEIAVRNATHARELILREHSNEAVKIANEEGDAVNAARQAKEDAWDTLEQAIHDERLEGAFGRGKLLGEASGDGEVAGLESKHGALSIAGTAAGEAIITGAGAAVDNIKIVGEQMATALKEGFESKAKELEAAGAKAAADAEKGAKKQAEISSPSKVWTALGANMRDSLIAALGDSAGAEAAARSTIRRASDAATEEFRRRRALGDWTAGAEHARRHQQRGMAMGRDGRMVDLGGAGGTTVVQLVLNRKILDEVVLETGIRGIRSSLQKNPLGRRRG